MAAVPSDVRQDVHALYREHHGWLQSWLRRKLENTFDAPDLAQDTFVRVLTAWGRGRPPELREPRAYLTTVARHVLLNHYRRLSLEKAFLATLASLPEAETPSVEDRLVILETLHDIDAMLDRLAPKVRTAFLLAQLEGLPYADIALRMQVNVRTVKRYMATAYEECLLLTP
ncbi:sigma-70 family RNA polymerase sigma factor [Paraburkholderia caballeronis]|uniref:RNA polymerase sigma-70 factor, ECF subfamily n=1 Tax=Paraburkholderia caballeronis TaxID=416943 RepID=A0A1H7STM6_9BURK|nr:sigma-70 family RNA polymerase sigma factor [Paraburkholderia caballeronis]PXW25647.1 RNA polymerase sigma-70 factor (ECF subfamily) [Paraburkholderia caballeronis]PXX01254.1 RNA polymerase sigma-70 factor (ECF subfamily) [Paraburkholderia caballeronis]RAJ99393.1 RNA polymerase sigma-70 factor (ECF subfamily) [Paraburkholderia caballeronis]TDV25544.1 RNA polymerase sigma-70 factor (ECF subfamily) [Paraburkholderia caballeronis]SEE28894.1 RNA polymerase sigma-70 factor, ECF subfamily [Parabu